MRRIIATKASRAKVVQLLIIFLLSFSLVNVFSIIRGLIQQDDFTYNTDVSDMITQRDDAIDGGIATEYNHKNGRRDKSQVNFRGNTTTKSNQLEQKMVIDCPDGIVARDVLYPKSMTHEGRKIPRVIHFIVPSKCFPKEINENLQQWLDLHVNYTILFHDQRDIDNFLSTDRKDLPHISDAAKCAIEPLAKLDLAR